MLWHREPLLPQCGGTGTVVQIRQNEKRPTFGSVVEASYLLPDVGASLLAVTEVDVKPAVGRAEHPSKDGLTQIVLYHKADVSERRHSKRSS